MKFKLLTIVYGRANTITFKLLDLNEERMRDAAEIDGTLIEMMESVDGDQIVVEAFDEVELVIGNVEQSLDAMLYAYKQYTIEEYSQGAWDELEGQFKRVVDMKEGDQLFF